jgi:hypothetical protein
MNPKTPNPTASLTHRILTAEAWKNASAKGMFTNYDVTAFWGTATHHDPKYSAWMVDQPEGATHVLVSMIDQGSGVLPTTEPA